MDNAPKEYVVINNTGEELQNILNEKDSTPSGDYYKTKEKIDNHIDDSNIHVTQSDKTKWNRVDDKVSKKEHDSFVIKTQEALAEKVPKEDGKGLSSNDFTDEYLEMLLNGTGISAQEVYIGTTEPTDPNILIWINPDEMPSVGNYPSGDGGVYYSVGIQSIEQTVASTEDGGENVITITLTDGTTQTFVVRNGNRGSDGVIGKDGYTPQKGVDYFTDEDIQEIASVVYGMIGDVSVNEDGNEVAY